MKRSRVILCLLLVLAALGQPRALGEPMPESRLIYLYVPACQSCARVSAFLDGLGGQVMVEGQDGEAFASRLVIRRLDLSAQPEAAEALFRRHGTPEAERIVPTVYLPGRYFAGADSVIEGLLASLTRGEGLAEGAAEPAEPAAVASRPLTLCATVGAGLIAGLNPCALSMLILLLGSLLHLGRRSAMLAGVFLLSKLLAYFLIGWLLLSALQAWDPVWLPSALRWLLSLAAGVLILLNLADAWRAARGEYGKVLNQLPASMRRTMQEGIRRAAASRRLLPAIALLGALVSAGEFLCAGQLYLAALLSSIRSGAGGARQLSLLAAYCLSFIAPSAVLTLVILRLQHTLMASDFIRRRMPLIKVLSALALALAVLYAWVV